MTQPESEERVQAQVTAAEFKRHVRQVSLFVITFCMIVIACVAVSLSNDMHAMRRAQVDLVLEFVKFRERSGAQLDSLGWKLDTQAEITGASNKILADALVKMRAQVKLNSDTGQKTATATTTIAREAVKQTAATTQLVQQVAESPTPVVNVEVPKTQPPPVVVQTPPAPAVRPITPRPPEKPAQPRRGTWHWLHWLWPWGKYAGRARQ